MKNLMLKNICKHFILITKHRIRVFKFCIKAGIPWRGFVHDLSKYSPTEFWESAKYYTGKGSPITQCKMDIQMHGYIIKEEINTTMSIGMIIEHQYLHQ